jgi:hypothetical protein
MKKNRSSKRIESPPVALSIEKKPEDAQLKSSKLITSLWYLAAILTFWSFGYTMLRGGDLWWHLAVGAWVVDHKALPLVDFWSFTREGQPWLQHEWLADLIYGIWARLFDVSSLVYWKWIILIATFVLLFYVVRSIGKEFISSYASVLLGIAIAAPFLDIRPHLYSLLGYVTLLILTLLPRHPPLYLPFVFLIWVNLHGGFFFGLMALSIILIVKTMKSDFVEWRRSAFIFAGCAIACLINPNGIYAFTYPLKYAFDKSSPFAKSIGEWQPPFAAGDMQSPLYPYAIGVFIAAVFFVLSARTYRKERGTPWIELALGFLTLAMSLTSRRFIPLFGISLSLLVGPVLGYLLAPRLRRIPKLIPALLAIFLGIIWLAPYPLKPYAFHYLVAEDNFPVEICNFIETNQLSGNLFAYYDWGGYLHYRTRGQMKVYIDGRADTVYDDQTLIRYSTVQGFRSGWEEIIESSSSNYVLWPRRKEEAQMGQLVTSGRWRVLYEDAVSILLVRSDFQLSSPLQPTNDSAYRRLASGIRNLEQRRYPEAEKDFRGAIDLQPHLQLACYSLVHAQASQGAKDQANGTLEHCQKIFPNRQKRKEFEEWMQQEARR